MKLTIRTHIASHIRKSLHILLWLATPLIIFFGLQHFEPRTIAGLLLLIFITRHHAQIRIFLSDLSLNQCISIVTFISLIAAIAVTNSEVLLRLYPVVISLGMLSFFATSLRYPPTIIERIARLQEPNLSPQGVRYTRHITTIWCIFFIINAGIAFYTTLYTSRETWALYNGLIAYCLMGGLMLGERLVRRYFITSNSI